MAAHTTSRRASAALAACAAAALGGGALAQGAVDRGTSDLGPNSASQRYVEPGNAQFSPEAALTDRFGPASPSQLADLYHRGNVSRRYLYQAPGVTALYNQSDYLTRDATGLVGLNGTNTASGEVVAITPPDIVYILSPELLDARPTRVVDEDPVVGLVDGRMLLTPLGSPTPSAGVNGQLSTRVDGRYDENNPRLVDVAAIEQRMRGAQRDPRLVERSRRWRAERAAAEAEAAALAAEEEAREGEASDENANTAPAAPAPVEAE